MPADLPDRYRVIEEVGQGGMAVVYRACDQALGREVAVKVLHAHLLSEGESKARLEREARAVAKLQHDNIVQIYDYSGADSRASFIVTEFIDGQTLRQFLAGGALPLPELAAMCVIEVAAAVAHAHGLGILHRDIKPENVMVRRDGLLKLMDFGVAQVMDMERMTVTGQLIGSPAYMAPELIEGKPVDVRTDVFALGIMLYQLATGKLPFSGRNPHEVFKRITDGRFAPARSHNPLVGVALDRILARALARAPDERYPNVLALVDELRAYTRDAGLGEARVALRAFFLDPPGEVARLRAAMPAALLDAGRAARREGRIARALELWSRALALRPDDAEVLREVRRIETGRRMRVALTSVGALALLLAGITLVIRAAGGPGPDEPPASMRVAPAPALPASAPVAAERTDPPSAAAGPDTERGASTGAEPTGAGAPAARVPAAAPIPSGAAGGRAGRAARANVRASGVPPRNGEPESAVPSPAPPAASARTFDLMVIPQRTEVWLDGVRRFTFGPGNTRLRVEDWTREHLLELKSPCCFPDSMLLGPGRVPDDLDRIVRRLRPKPAHLTVELEPAPPGASILLETADGGWRAPATPGRMVLVPFEDGGEFVRTLRALVFVGESTTPAATSTFEVRAGEDLRHVVPVSR